MTDINFENFSNADSGHFDSATGTSTDHEQIPPEIMELIELFFFAYRDFISDPDLILSKLEFGRAHHRVLHFIVRNPGLRVAELLDILKITKQSLGRVLKQLIVKGYVYQTVGEVDRRQRLLFPTRKGTELSRQLSLPQFERIKRIFDKIPNESRNNVREFLLLMTNTKERSNIEKLTRKQFG